MKDGNSGRTRGGRWRGIVATLAASAMALAVGTPALAASVTPTVIGGASNVGKTCAEVFPGVEGLHELKVDPVPDGSYSESDGELTVGIVKPSTQAGSLNSFDFTASGGYVVMGVVVKDGVDGANFYDYSPGGTTADTYLTTPLGGDKGISHVSFCYTEPQYTQLPLNVEKTAAGTYDRTVRWELEKTVEPVSHIGFAGELAGESTWTVTVTKYEELGNYEVTGTITVENPNDRDVVVSIADQLEDGTVAIVTCPVSGDNTGTVPMKVGDVNGSLTCTYVAHPEDDWAEFNTAVVTVVSPTDIPGGPPGQAEISWTEHLVGFDSAILTDYRFPSFEETITASGEWTFNLPEEFYCDAADDPQARYEAGTYTIFEENTAELAFPSGTPKYATEFVEITCYLPSAVKTAAGTYDETHTWSVDKSVTPSAQSGYPGDELGWTWQVDVTEEAVEGNFEVVGSITITNPHPDVALKATVTDVLDDAAGTEAIVDCDPDPLVTSNEVMVPKGGTAECTYSALPVDRTSEVNTATVTTDHGTFTATEEIEWEANVIGGTAIVTDWKIGLDEPLTAGEGPWTWTKSYAHVCSSDAAAYGESGSYSMTRYNKAKVVASSGQYDRDWASTTFTCEAGFMDLQKLTEGVVDETAEWYFELYGPDGFGSTPIGTGNVLGDADGVLEFGHPALRPDTTYTVCELGLPVGYTSEWMVNRAPVTPYNPDYPENLGNRCVDFGAATAIPVMVGQTIHFVVDNLMLPSPRTPGYWKNWSRCTGGNQVATAERNGGSAEGYWLVDDVLPIIWPDVTIATCQQAVEIMSMRVVTANAVVNDGKVLASDPARQLARNLLAAQANLAAGVYAPVQVEMAMEDALWLLDQINFTGTRTTAYLKPTTGLGPQAHYLAGVLDDFNNGMYMP